MSFKLLFSFQGRSLKRWKLKKNLKNGGKPFDPIKRATDSKKSLDESIGVKNDSPNGSAGFGSKAINGSKPEAGSRKKSGEKLRTLWCKGFESPYVVATLFPHRHRLVIKQGKRIIKFFWFPNNRQIISPLLLIEKRKTNGWRGYDHPKL